MILPVARFYEFIQVSIGYKLCVFTSFFAIFVLEMRLRNILPSKKYFVIGRAITPMNITLLTYRQEHTIGAGNYASLSLSNSCCGITFLTLRPLEP